MSSVEYQEYLTRASTKEPNLLYPSVRDLNLVGPALISLSRQSLRSKDIIGFHGTSFNGIMEMINQGGLKAHPKRYCDEGTIDFVPLTGNYPKIGNFGIPLINAISYASVYAESGALYDVLEEALPFVPGFVDWRTAAHRRDSETIEEIAKKLAEIWNYDNENMRRLLVMATQRKGFLVGLGKGVLNFELKPGEGAIVGPDELEINFAPNEVLPIKNPDGSINIVYIFPCGPLEHLFLSF